MSWLRTPWSVKTVTAAIEKEWLAANATRQRFKLSKLERDLLFSGEHPIRFVISLIVLQLTLLELMHVLPDAWFTPTWGSWGAAEQLSYFATLWTVQATLAALVYPIVIAFVAVFLQRRPAAEAFVHLYMLDSAALAAGLSSVALVVVMGVQYLLLTTWGTESLLAWTAVDTLWFVLNAALTTFFLFRTVEFLRPEVQARVVQRYAIGVALPRDVARLNEFQALAKGWLPIPLYGDEAAPAGPRLSIGRALFREGEVQGVLPLKSPHRLTNVRLWPLRLALESWHRLAKKHEVQINGNPLEKGETLPLLILPIAPGSVWDDEVKLASVSHGPKLTGSQLRLIRLSIVIRPLTRERLGIRVQSILDELANDARNAASRGDNESFERAYESLIGLHELLLNACRISVEDGQSDSWAMLNDTETFFHRRLHENWHDVYRSVFEAALHGVFMDSRPLRRLCHIIQHLDDGEVQKGPIGVRLGLQELPPLFHFLMGNWWSRRVEEQGIVDHTHLQKVYLRPPQNVTYDEMLSTFVAGWENGSPNKRPQRGNAKTFDWDSAPMLAQLSVNHIEETAKMLLASVRRGDAAAAEWLADVLAKWWDPFEQDDRPYQLYGKTAFITLEHLGLEWEAFATAFGISDTTEVQTADSVQQLQYGAYRAALRNYWNDIRLLVIELLVHWLLLSEGDDVDSALSAEIAAGMLLGKQWRAGNQVSDSFLDLSAPSYLTAKARQYCGSGEWRTGYIALLDRFVERAKATRETNVVSSRVYSFSGADNVESLVAAQLAVFAVLTSAPWQISQGLRTKVEYWMTEQHSSVAIFLERLRGWAQAQDEMPKEEWNVVAKLKSRARDGHALDESKSSLRSSMEAARNLVESMKSDNLAAQPIDEGRLAEIARAASGSAFSTETGDFPLPLLKVEVGQEEFQDFVVTLKQVQRGELTRVEMAQRALNEAEFYDEMLRKQVAVVVLSDILRHYTPRDIVATDAETYWTFLKTEAANFAARGDEATLLLDNGTRPDWVWDWQHPEFNASYKRPDDLRVQRREGGGHGYVCHFNDIAVYVAPLRFGESLLMGRSAFNNVKFRQYGPARFVHVEVDDSGPIKTLVDLKFTFSRQVEVRATDVFCLVYADKQSESE